jgi:hypothetical protein
MKLDLEVAVTHLARVRRTGTLAAVGMLVLALFALGANGCSSEDDSVNPEAA